MCTRLSLLFAVVFSMMLGIAMPTRSLWAQGGMDMSMGMDSMYGEMDMGMGGTAPPSPSSLPLKVTILLGPDYGFETKPFMTVQDVLKCFREDALRTGRTDTGISATNVLYLKPTSGLIDLDMKLSIPDKPERHVIARMPEGLKEEDVDSWKRKIRLKALRFGLNRVTFLPSDFSIPKDQSSMWLQVPVGSQPTLKSNMEQHIAIALDLAESSETNGRRPRIDLFFSQELANHDPFTDPFAPTSQKHDPFAASADSDPFAKSAPKKTSSNQRSDPFAAGADPFAAPPVKKHASLEVNPAIKDVLAQTQLLRQQISQEFQNWSESDGKEASKEKARIKKLFTDLEKEQIRMKHMHIQQLEEQLKQISESIQQLSQPDAIEQRVQKQIELLEKKLKR